MKNKLIYLFFSLLLVISNSAFAKTEFEIYRETLLTENVKSIAALYAQRANITGIELLIAESADDIESKWGHALLRFLGTGKLSFNDTTISFSALINQSEFSGVGAPIGYSKGIFGSYEIIPDVLPLKEVWKNNNLNAGRTVYRYIIPTSSTQRMKIVEKLYQWALYRNSKNNPLQSYYFFSKNCGTLLMHLLEEAGLAFPGALGGGNENNQSQSKWSLDTSLKGIVAPTDTPFLLQNELLIPFLALRVPSLQQKLKEKGILIDNKKLSRGQWPENFLHTLQEKKVDYNTLNQILRIQNIPSKTRQQLAEYIHTKADDNGDFSPGAYFDFTDIPPELYQQCTDGDLACGKQIQAASRKVWQWSQVVKYADGTSEKIYDDEWRMAFRQRLEIYNNYLQKYSQLNRLTEARSTPQAMHFQVLLNTL